MNYNKLIKSTGHQYRNPAWPQDEGDMSFLQTLMVKRVTSSFLSELMNLSEPLCDCDSSEWSYGETWQKLGQLNCVKIAY